MSKRLIYGSLLLALLVAPFVGYPMFLMKVLCFGLFACAFNLLIGVAAHVEHTQQLATRNTLNAVLGVGER
jgi:ABC-type branched-subunit amino acid transport system permease subunit